MATKEALSLPRGYSSSGMGLSRKGQICSQPRPSSADHGTTRRKSAGILHLSSLAGGEAVIGDG